MLILHICGTCVAEPTWVTPHILWMYGLYMGGIRSASILFHPGSTLLQYSAMRHKESCLLRIFGEALSWSASMPTPMIMWWI